MVACADISGDIKRATVRVVSTGSKLSNVLTYTIQMTIDVNKQQTAVKQ